MSLVACLQGQLIAEMYSAAMDIKPSTPLVSWSLAKSVTSAIVGVRTADTDMDPDFSQFQLATTPVWNASEVAARNITGMPTISALSSNAVSKIADVVVGLSICRGIRESPA